MPVSKIVVSLCIPTNEGEDIYKNYNMTKMTDKKLIKQSKDELTVLKSNPTFDTIYDIVDSWTNENTTIEERNFLIKHLSQTYLVNNK